MTKQKERKLTDLLAEMAKNSKGVSRTFEQDKDFEAANNFRTEARVYSELISIITDDELFNRLCEIYEIK